MIVLQWCSWAWNKQMYVQYWFWFTNKCMYSTDCDSQTNICTVLIVIHYKISNICMYVVFFSLDAFKFYFFKDLWYLSHSVFLYQKSLCLEYNSSVGFLKMRLDMILKPLCHKLCPMEALTMLCSHWLKSSAVEARLMTFGSILTRWFS